MQPQLSPQEQQGMNGHYEIKGWRVVLGLTVGAAAAVIYFVVKLYPIWAITSLVGVALAVVFVTLVGVPLYLYFSQRRKLNVYVAVLSGGLLTTLPYLIFTLFRLHGTFIHLEKVGSTTLIVDNKLTNEGWWEYFFWGPVWFLPAGMIGGLIAWVIAVGFHARPPVGTSVG